MQHQGLYILAYLNQRHYDIDEVAELADLDPAQLAAYLQMPVLPGYVVEKIAFHIAAKLPEDFFKLPGDGQPFG